MVRSDQLSLFAPGPGLPPGLAYRADLITLQDERALVAQVAALPFRAFQFHGFEGRRRVVSFGRRYDFGDEGLHAAEPLPEFLEPLRAAAAAFAGEPAEAFAHALVTEYAPGAAIGWHRDKAVFGTVVGVSLGAPCRFRLRRRAGAKWERAEFVAEPRSAYVLRGPARRDWEHSIPPVEALRYSITFRTLADGSGRE
jgi:alkylated DNA repair dioxygenase AlkB